MSDYRFRCTDCGKINQTHSTGTTPEYGEEVECINCGRISIVQSSTAILEVKMSCKKNSPSKIEQFANCEAEEQ